MQVFSLPRSSTPDHRGHVDISTSYVDRLQSYSSPAPSIVPTPQDGILPGLERAPASPKFTDTEPSSSEQTPLMVTTVHTPRDPHHDPDPSYGAVHHRDHTHDLVDSDASIFFEGHHRHESRNLHQSHHERCRPATMYGLGEFAQGQPSGVGGSGHRHHHVLEDVEDVTYIPEPHHHHHHCHVDEHEGRVKVGKKRQIVGILVRLNL